MDSELTFKAISYGVIGLLLVTALVLSLISVWKESRSNVPIKGLIALTLAVIVLSAFIGFVWNTLRQGIKKKSLRM